MIGFAAPLLLWGLVGLPMLWLILRAVPPAPVVRRFPGVALLLGLQDDDSQSARTPWWLLALRMLALALVILGFAGPVLNPVADTGRSDRNLLIVMDGGWASAPDWAARKTQVGLVLDRAGRDGRAVAVVRLSDPTPPEFLPATAWKTRLPGIEPAPWAPDGRDWATNLTGNFDSHWISDGLHRPARADVLAALETHGTVQVYETGRVVYGLTPAQIKDGDIHLRALRSPSMGAGQVVVNAIGPDPSGVERILAALPVEFAPGAGVGVETLTLPIELRNRITRFDIAGTASAGAVHLTGDSLQKRKIALIAGRQRDEAAALLSPLHYVRQALTPTSDLIDTTLRNAVQASPDAIVLADVATLTAPEITALTDWVNGGGVLVRFAGPLMAAADLAADPLLPVRLRKGGRSIGGTMSWGEDRPLAPFPGDSPFAGVPVPNDVTVQTQVLAEPGPDLAGRVIATLADGTPLVTRRVVGQGQVVLFHVTANADWSNLPLSGLFVQMLDRLALATRPVMADASALKGTTWQADQVLDGYGRLHPAPFMAGVDGPRLTERTGPDLPPGLYAGEDRRMAVNVLQTGAELHPAQWPARITVAGPTIAGEQPLGGVALALGLLLLLLDILAALWLTGRLRGAAAVLLALWLAPDMSRAQDTKQAIAATSQVVLAHVLTGDAQVDDLAHAGLKGISNVLMRRTSVEPGAPVGVDVETDELAFYPLLYWPVTADTPLPSAQAVAKLNAYMRHGGMIVFDTRDGDLAGLGDSTPAGRRLRAIAAPLNIPPLAPLGEGHVLTRSFYLLDAFPGRAQGAAWGEAVQGTQNDGVTRVIIGGNDWAGAWAVDANGNRMLPVGRGTTGERQREMAYRFGVNLVMYVLTGNYKADQVHVPELLERLGQ